MNPTTAPQYGPESAPLTVEEARKMPNGNWVCVPADEKGDRRLWVGLSPIFEGTGVVQCAYTGYRPYHLKDLRPADEAAAIAIGRLPAPDALRPEGREWAPGDVVREWWVGNTQFRARYNDDGVLVPEIHPDPVSEWAPAILWNGSIAALLGVPLDLNARAGGEG